MLTCGEPIFAFGYCSMSPSLNMFAIDQRHKFLVASKLQKRSLLIAINSLAAISIFFFGYDQGLMGGVNESPDYVNTMEIGYVDLHGQIVITNTLLQGGIVAIFYIGTLVGCLAGGAFGDKYGRIPTIALGAIWAILGASLQTAAQNHVWMLCSRVINGVGVGVLNAIVPAWASEVAEYKSRGAFIAMEFTLNILGVVVAYWLAYGVSYVDDGVTAFRWRFPIGFQIIPLLILFAICWVFPESPRWLAKVGRDEEAHYVLQRLRGIEGEDSGKADAELKDIRDVVVAERAAQRNNSYFHMFFGLGSGELHTGRRVQLCIWLQVMQSWTGIAGVTIFGPKIFAIAGFTDQKGQWIAGLNNIFYTLSTLICVFTLDRIGRRWTLWWGAVGQAIAMFLVGGFSRLGLDASANGNTSSASQYGAAAASFVYIYTFIFGATWLTVPWLYQVMPGESSVGRSAMGESACGYTMVEPDELIRVNRTLTLALPYIADHCVPELSKTEQLTRKAVSVWALYPESNQRTLEQMDALFSASTPWVWDAERNFQRLLEQNPEMSQTKRRASADTSDKVGSMSVGHNENVV
nr:sugar transporter stl1 [Quercus suber]